QVQVWRCLCSVRCTHRRAVTLTSQPHFGLCGGQPATGGVLLFPRVATTGITIAGIAARIPSVIALPLPGGCPPFCTTRPLEISVVEPAFINTSSVACVGGCGPVLSFVRTLENCPAFTSTHAPARLQTFTTPSNTVTFIVPVALSKPTKKSVPTTPA